MSGIVIDAAGEAVVMLGGAAKLSRQAVEAHRPQVGDGADAQAAHLYQSGGADAPETLHGQGQQDAIQVVAVDDRQAVGLVEPRGELGEELVKRHAHGGGQAQLVVDALLDRGRNRGGGAGRSLHAGDVEEGLVNADGLDERGAGFQDRQDALGHLADALTRHLHDDGVEAEPPGGGHGHRRVAAEAAGLVAGGGDDAARAGAPGEHGLAAERPVVKHGDGREEGVHVHVEDGAVGRHEVMLPALMGWTNTLRTRRAGHHVLWRRRSSISPTRPSMPSVPGSGMNWAGSSASSVMRTWSIQPTQRSSAAWPVAPMSSRLEPM